MRIRLLAVSAALVVGIAYSQEGDTYRYSAEEARKLGRTEEKIFHEEFGDPEGPFRWVASSHTTSVGYPRFKARIGNEPATIRPDIDDRTIRYEVRFFVNRKGNSFGVVHRTSATSELLPELRKKDPRPHGHVALCEAAEFAAFKKNFELLEMLLASGLELDLPLTLDSGWTLLHNATVIKDAELTKWLLNRGATRNLRDEFGRRPIDYAFDKADWAICELLRQPEKEEVTIAGFPVGLIEEAFLKRTGPRNIACFVEINGSDPAPELLAHFAKRWSEATVLPVSRMREVSRGEAEKAGSNSVFRDRESGNYGNLVELQLKKGEDGRYEWRHRIATGPSLSGGGTKGNTIRKYGYWISTTTASWDE